MSVQITPRFRPAVRASRLARASIWAFLGLQVMLGAVSGILIGALLLNWMHPGHPFFIAIEATLKKILGM